MTAQHGYPSGGGSAGRGIVLVVVAIALGAFLLYRGFGGADDPAGDSVADPASESSEDAENESDSGGGAEPGSDNGGGGEELPVTTLTTTTVPPVVTHPPGEVKVVAANGTGERGRAGRTADVLNALGFVTEAKNTEQSRVEESVIYYRPEYGDDAKAVAAALGAPAQLLTLAPDTILHLIRDSETPENLGDFNIFVVLGTDNAILDPNPEPAAT